MMYDSGLPGQWVNLGELEAILDDLRAQVDRLQGRKSIRQISEIPIRCAAYRAAIDEVDRAAVELARVGIMCAAIPVYNLGIVDRPGEGPGSRGSGGGPGSSPAVENLGGEEG